MTVSTLPPFDNKPAVAIRMLMADAIPQRAADGKFAKRKHLERDCLHEMMRRQIAAPAAERTTPEPQKPAVAQAVERRFVTAPKKRRSVAAVGRAACVIVGVASIVAGLAIDGAAFGALASLPVPKLLATALGRGI